MAPIISVVICTSPRIPNRLSEPGIMNSSLNPSLKIEGVYSFLSFNINPSRFSSMKHIFC